MIEIKPVLSVPMPNINTLTVLAVLAASGLIYLMIRYLLFVSGYKDNNYPIVQRAERQLPPKDLSAPFLPGSRSDSPKSKEAPKVEEVPRKARKKTYKGFTREEIRRSFLLDELFSKRDKH